MTDMNRSMRPDDVSGAPKGEPAKSYEELEREFEALEQDLRDAFREGRHDDVARIETAMIAKSKELQAAEGNPFTLAHEKRFPK
jgi:hypothetical protein